MSPSPLADWGTVTVHGLFQRPGGSATGRGGALPREDSSHRALHRFEDGEWIDDHVADAGMHAARATSPVHAHAAAMHWKNCWRAEVDT